MPTLVLTGVKPAYNRPDFLAIVLQWVTSDITLANQYVNAVIGGANRDMVVSAGQIGVIATELDVAGVNVIATFVCTSVQAGGAYSRATFIVSIKAHVNPQQAFADQFATDVENGTDRLMLGKPGVIATELDVAGVVFHAQ